MFKRWIESIKLLLSSKQLNLTAHTIIVDECV